MADPLEQGIAALRAGDKAKARQLLSLAVQQAPRSEKAWLWLSGAMESDDDRLKCLKRVLTINRANEAARLGVAELEKRMAGKESVRHAPAAQAQVAPGRAVVEARRRARRQLQVKGEEAAPSCRVCGAEIPAGQKVVLDPKRKGGMPEVLCVKCADDREREYRAETENPNLIGALLAGLVAAVVAAAAWFGVVVLTKYLIAYAAIAVGMVVGAAVVVGSGGKRGRSLQVMSVLIALTAVGFTEYLVARYGGIQVHGPEGYPLLVGPGRMLEMIVDGIEQDYLTLLFWGVCLLVAFAVPAKRSLRRAGSK